MLDFTSDVKNAKLEQQRSSLNIPSQLRKRIRDAMWSWPEGKDVGSTSSPSNQEVILDIMQPLEANGGTAFSLNNELNVFKNRPRLVFSQTVSGVVDPLIFHLPAQRLILKQIRCLEGR